ncbi:hypothetical protein KUTeg_017104, partial [Tegillarca granosa]
MGIPLSQTLLEKAEDVEEGAPVLINRKVKRVFSDSSDVMSPVKAVPTQAVKVDETVEEVDSLEVPKLELKMKEKYAVTMSVSVNPGDFWCNLLENSEEHQIYQDLLQERYTDDSDVAPESEVEIGYICVAKFCDDEQYYRVRVVTEKNDCGKLEVLLFDYGNITSVKVSELKKIRAEDLVLPQQGIHCKVAGIAPDSEDDIWDEKSYSRFEELTFTKDLFIVPQKLDHQTYVVDLCENENSIGELLVQGGYAKK